MSLQDFIDAYIECALWSSTDNSDDSGGYALDSDVYKNGELVREGYNADDLTPEALESVRTDCEAFYEDNAEHLEVYRAGLGYNDEQAGHDFWLTRNHHGAGYWDRYYGKDEDLLAACKALTDEAHVYGSSYMDETGDGKINVYPG